MARDALMARVTVANPHAVAHPIRLEIIEAMGRREMSAKELSGVLPYGLPVLSYHVRRLAQAGLLTQTRTRHVRGAIQKFYTADRAARNLVAAFRRFENDA